MIAATAVVSGITQSAVPVCGRRRPRTRAHTGRASAAAALRMMRPVTPTVAEKVRRPKQLSADGQRRRVIGLAEDLDDVLAVAALCDGPQFGQGGVEVRAAGGACGGVGNAQHGSTIAQHADQWSLHVAQQATGVVGDPVGQEPEVVDHPAPAPDCPR